MKTTSLTPGSKNGFANQRNQNGIDFKPTHKHRHIDAQYQLLSICENGSWKGLILDKTSGNKKPKGYTVQNGYKDQWEKII